ncbi:MAG: hypothetical protein WD361_05385 [Gracilimonas sp.]
MTLSIVHFFIIFLLFPNPFDLKPDSAKMLGHFDIQKDLYLAHFDSKTDVDDLHSVAGVATMLADPRFAKVKYHAVAGAYGIQEGLYVPANDLFEMAFGEHWSDAHQDFEQALTEVTSIAAKTLQSGGSIWIADAGQSDFSAALVRNIGSEMPEIDLKSRVHIVQHSDWNESVTSPEELAFVKAHISYHRIPDGNEEGNGSPGFNTEEDVEWQNYLTDPELISIWQTAIETANKYNGAEGRYNNPTIAKGGLDFSDVAETAWIFGFNELEDVTAFFTEFSN